MRPPSSRKPRIAGRVSEHPSGWPVLQIAELVRAADALLLDGLARLPGITAELPEDADVVLASTDSAELRALGELLAELAGHLQTLTEGLPEGDVDVVYHDVADAAADDLASGIIDPARALLAARVLPIETGWPALAKALRSTDTHAAWDGTSVGELLRTFRGADEQLVVRVLTVAELAPETPFDAFDACAVARLAAALEEHAPRAKRL
jgi:hypothetical protein